MKDRGEKRCKKMKKKKTEYIISSKASIYAETAPIVDCTGKGITKNERAKSQLVYQTLKQTFPCQYPNYEFK